MARSPASFVLEVPAETGESRLRVHLTVPNSLPEPLYLAMKCSSPVILVLLEDDEPILLMRLKPDSAAPVLRQIVWEALTRLLHDDPVRDEADLASFAVDPFGADLLSIRQRHGSRFRALLTKPTLLGPQFLTGQEHSQLASIVQALGYERGLAAGKTMPISANDEGWVREKLAAGTLFGLPAYFPEPRAALEQIYLYARLLAWESTPDAHDIHVAEGVLYSEMYMGALNTAHHRGCMRGLAERFALKPKLMWWERQATTDEQ